MERPPKISSKNTDALRLQLAGLTSNRHTHPEHYFFNMVKNNAFEEGDLA